MAEGTQRNKPQTTRAEERRQRVEMLKASVLSGTYRVDEALLAARLLARAHELMRSH